MRVMLDVETSTNAIVKDLVEQLDDAALIDFVIKLDIEIADMEWTERLVRQLVNSMKSDMDDDEINNYLLSLRAS